MTNFRTVKTFNSSLGGHSYRITSDGQVYRLQRRTPASSSFSSRVELDRAEFEEFAARVGLWNPARDDPGVVAHEIRRWEDMLEEEGK